ncbi:unnamed protein product [Prorocentrum cordatum]|uniref:Uncharacterized protein n=1 Tax=Prorocentrum cordatum TaxID=2364126 RepID=A0ABN9T046_9DINO|nr:unnamed protein product [Polarella glacialis]
MKYMVTTDAYGHVYDHENPMQFPRDDYGAAMYPLTFSYRPPRCEGLDDWARRLGAQGSAAAGPADGEPPQPGAGEPSQSGAAPGSSPTGPAAGEPPPPGARGRPSGTGRRLFGGPRGLLGGALAPPPPPWRRAPHAGEGLVAGQDPQQCHVAE